LASTFFFSFSKESYLVKKFLPDLKIRRIKFLS
jgi:hypothetical protein